MGSPSRLIIHREIRLFGAQPFYHARRWEFKLLSAARVRPVKRDEKLNPSGDWLVGPECRGLLIHDPMTLYVVRICLASANQGVQALLLYNVGYSLLLSGNRKSSSYILKILEKLDKNLSALLSSKLNKDLPNQIVE
jgi:hypothetical protein